MKILCFIDSLGSGGAQRQIVELAKGFKEKGHDVSFLTYHNISFFKPELDKYSISVKTIEESNYIKRLFKIRKAIRKHKPDAVLSFLEAANFMATFAGFPFQKWKLVLGERNAKPNINKSLKKITYRYFHLFADFVVSNSNANLKSVLQVNPFLSKKKTEVIYNIVDFENFKENEIISIDEKTKIVIAASYLKKKNLDGLIEALQLLPDKYKLKLKINWYGNISMDNSYYQAQLEKINQFNLNKVLTLNDKTNHINQKYAAADFVGLFSHYEGFPNTICEAMAMAKPVIVTRVSDVPLFIKENENGFLCESNQPESIKNALIKAIDATTHQRKKMGKNNYNAAIQQFNKNVIVEQYLKLLGDGK